jgi:hypothetical protein
VKSQSRAEYVKRSGGSTRLIARMRVEAPKSANDIESRREARPAGLLPRRHAGGPLSLWAPAARQDGRTPFLAPQSVAEDACLDCGLS